MTDSDIMDGFMNLIYSSIQYKMKPIADVAKIIMDNDSSWPFGNNVVDCITKFINKYNNYILGATNIYDYNDNEISILRTMREYGIDLHEYRDYDILSFIKAIEEKLEQHYSTYDLIKAINTIASEQSAFSDLCKNIQKDYFL